jgi:hypothetical protein
MFSSFLLTPKETKQRKSAENDNFSSALQAGSFAKIAHRAIS